MCYHTVLLYGRITAGSGDALQEVDGNAARAVLSQLVCWAPSSHGQKTCFQPAYEAACGRCGGIRHEGSGKGGDTGSSPYPTALGMPCPSLCATAPLLRAKATPVQK